MGQARWRDAVHAIETYRTRWSITDPDRPLGQQHSVDPLQRHELTHTLTAIRQARHTVAELHPPERERSLYRGLSR